MFMNSNLMLIVTSFKHLYNVVAYYYAITLEEMRVRDENDIGPHFFCYQNLQPSPYSYNLDTEI